MFYQQPPLLWCSATDVHVCEVSSNSCMWPLDSRTIKEIVSCQDSWRVLLWGSAGRGLSPRSEAQNWTPQPPLYGISLRTEGRGRGRATQDILTGCESWTPAGAVRCGGKSQLRGVFGFRSQRSASGCVCALRMWNQHGQDALRRLVVGSKSGKCPRGKLLR